MRAEKSLLPAHDELEAVDPIATSVPDSWQYKAMTQMTTVILFMQEKCPVVMLDHVSHSLYWLSPRLGRGHMTVFLVQHRQ